MVLNALVTAFRYVFKKSATIKYPYEVRILPDRTRGRHILVSDKCTGCSMCAMVCPAKAITMGEAPDDMQLPKTNAKRRIPHIDYTKCILCGMCVDVCNFDALFMSPNIFISGRTLDELRISPKEYSTISGKLEEYREKVMRIIAPKVRELVW